MDFSIVRSLRFSQAIQRRNAKLAKVTMHRKSFYLLPNLCLESANRFTIRLGLRTWTITFKNQKRQHSSVSLVFAPHDSGTNRTILLTS